MLVLVDLNNVYGTYMVITTPYMVIIILYMVITAPYMNKVYDTYMVISTPYMVNIILYMVIIAPYMTKVHDTISRQKLLTRRLKKSAKKPMPRSQNKGFYFSPCVSTTLSKTYVKLKYVK